jgi:hypothetical protein
MKRAIFLLGGICWMFFGFGFLFLLYEDLVQGAGLQFWIPIVSSGSVLVGLVHFVGLSTAAVLCFGVGSGLWAYGMVKPDRREEP